MWGWGQGATNVCSIWIGSKVHSALPTGVSQWTASVCAILPQIVPTSRFTMQHESLNGLELTSKLGQQLLSRSLHFPVLGL